MKKISYKELSENMIRLIGEDWMLISAGTPEKFNTMTASWGGMGYLWNKPVVFVFIRPERYTYEFTEANDRFTLSFFASEYRKALGICGSKSGRDTDKIAESGLTPFFTDQSNLPAFKEARIVIECRKLYKDMLKADKFIEKDNLEKWYDTSHGGLHDMYIAEIENVWIENK